MSTHNTNPTLAAQAAEEIIRRMASDGEMDFIESDYSEITAIIAKAINAAHPELATWKEMAKRLDKKVIDEQRDHVKTCGYHDKTKAQLANAIARAERAENLVDLFQDSNRHLKLVCDLIDIYDAMLVRRGEPRKDVYSKAHVQKMRHIQRLVLFHGIRLAEYLIARIADESSETKQQPPKQGD